MSFHVAAFCEYSTEDNVKSQFSSEPTTGGECSKCFAGSNSFHPHKRWHGDHDYPPFTTWQEDRDAERINSCQVFLPCGWQSQDVNPAVWVQSLHKKQAWAGPQRGRFPGGGELGEALSSPLLCPGHLASSPPRGGSLHVLSVNHLLN